ncbi:radical SAM family heme chaperone HemW [Clostridium sp. SYSU_GA19001]|uniref:radical SAM family heme chaperone HemW n=1 Tax=Clostridium caldaquaticum TaxID=2940653 RepID=UPI0020777F67|nr:radical SAM family heme chaperone HemW [Clostridium caldaquaticum]MCM8710399.1 radical SAM family heme chaperone HemW [Clostridium caldaquaticum]
MNKGLALYIHVPFCKQKCLYCDFPSFSGKESLMLDYVKALCKEIDNSNYDKINTIFIGGGTPTYLCLECLEYLKNSIDKLCKADDLEFTIEGNPDSLNKEKLKFFKSMGVNRLSIGLQAWQDRLLKNLGRVHTLEQFRESYLSARDIGFNNINIDLMFGLPGQSIEDWKESLINVSNLKPEHISCYSLIVEDGTPFCNLDKLGKLNLPEEEDERKMYQFAVDFLKSIGYEQYEISNFSKPEFQCRHNLTYWNLNYYIGCGMGAHSYVNGIRYRNYEDIEKYICMINDNKSPVAEEHINSLKDDMEEFMFMGLRKIEGISIEEFNKRFNKDINKVYGIVIEKFLKNKLLKSDGKYIYLSPRGIELSNRVMCEFIL